MGVASASLNRGAPASHRSEFPYAEDTLSRAISSRLRLRSSISVEVLENWHASLLDFELN
jgi:hypothetical protein